MPFLENVTWTGFRHKSTQIGRMFDLLLGESRGVTRLDGARVKFGAAMFEPAVFPKQRWCSKETTFDIMLEFFGGPRSDSVLHAVIRRPHIAKAPGKMNLPCPSSLRPGVKVV